MRLRVLTLNTQNGEGDRRRSRLLNQEVRRWSPDLVALQDVASPGDRDLLAELVAGTGLHATHLAQCLDHPPPLSDRYGGTAVATRWPHRVLEVVERRLPQEPEVPWCALAVAMPVPDRLDDRHRATLPTVIAGDLNASPDAASIRYLSGLQSLDGHSVHYHDAWAIAGQGPGHTWSVDNPRAAAEIAELIGSPATDVGWTTSSSAPPTSTRQHAPGSCPRSSSCRSPSTGSGSATMPGAWSTSRSSRPDQDLPRSAHCSAAGDPA